MDTPFPIITTDAHYVVSMIGTSVNGGFEGEIDVYYCYMCNLRRATDQLMDG